jgi:hypothetical protein
MKRAAFMLILVSLVACGKAGEADRATDSGIVGRVFLGPQCPVVSSDNPCRERPFQADIQVVDRSGDLVTTARSDRNGRFNVALDPGRYDLKPVSPSQNHFPFGKEVSASVRPHRFTRVTVLFDTGIR